jgi:hypothetical protein
MTGAVKERFQRVLRLSKRTFDRSRFLKIALLGGILLLIGLLVGIADHSPNLAHMHVSVLSASRQGNYHEIVNILATEAQQQQGRIDNIPSAGSVENISRLVASRDSCDVQFALVQEGLGWPAGAPLELIGRLPEAESLVFLGPRADQVKALTDLRGMRIGI